MPSIKCKCGNIISYGEIPSKNEYLFISDVEYDKVETPLDAEKLYKIMNSFLKCNKCERLWLFWKGFSNEPTEYIMGNKEGKTTTTRSF